MCVTQNIYFDCGCLEDTRYMMCDKAMTEIDHETQMAPPVIKTHPCAACFAKGLEEKARQTREGKERAEGSKGERMDQS